MGGDMIPVLPENAPRDLLPPTKLYLLPFHNLPIMPSYYESIRN
jgi:hypothetical protein